MENVLRALAVYFFLLIIMRLVGRRMLSELTTFDFVLLLILGEAAQNALVGDDFSLTTFAIVSCTLFAAEIFMSILKNRFPRLDKTIDGVPIILINDGEILHDRLKQERVGLDDILEAARKSQGVGRLDEIRYAVLERNGGISIIPKK
jgi:uncharacterized membrane protein YcaP (DUF421 family)